MSTQKTMQTKVPVPQQKIPAQPSADPVGKTPSRSGSIKGFSGALKPGKI